MARILIACEESQIVTAAFRFNGVEAYSCDTLETSGDYPEWHYQCDVQDVLYDGWDAVIAFPPCTHLSSSGARHWEAKRKDGRQQDAIDFFMLFANLECPYAIENPVGIISSYWRKPDQVVQPYEFGDDASKRTCLWLNELPPLVGTLYIEPRVVNGKKRWSNQTDSGQNKLTPSPDRAKIRSKTYPGIASAMAEQWGEYMERLNESDS